MTEVRKQRNEKYRKNTRSGVWNGGIQLKGSKYLNFE
jgi:hypothetical protein